MPLLCLCMGFRIRSPRSIISPIGNKFGEENRNEIQEGKNIFEKNEERRLLDLPAIPFLLPPLFSSFYGSEDLPFQSIRSSDDR